MKKIIYELFAGRSYIIKENEFFCGTARICYWGMNKMYILVYIACTYKK